jgi:hypothetical protein
MKILRIINKENGVFIRDDFKFDIKTEIALDVKPAQGFAFPQWNGSEWVECPKELVPPQSKILYTK